MKEQKYSSSYEEMLKKLINERKTSQSCMGINYYHPSDRVCDVCVGEELRKREAEINQEQKEKQEWKIPQWKKETIEDNSPLTPFGMMQVEIRIKALELAIKTWGSTITGAKTEDIIETSEQLYTYILTDIIN